jgi:hypothetical protein
VSDHREGQKADDGIRSRALSRAPNQVIASKR